jgi:hypothetical protein
MHFIMEQVIQLRIILESPTPGVDFALQKGKGSNYGMVQVQRSSGRNLVFEFNVGLRQDTARAAVFTGPFAQGNPQDRFVYLDIGSYAGQKDSAYGRRLKIPLTVTQELIAGIHSREGSFLQAIVAGTDKSGAPACGTAKPFDGWKLVKV